MMKKNSERTEETFTSNRGMMVLKDNYLACVFNLDMMKQTHGDGLGE